MSDTGGPAAGSHMHDVESHVTALEADIEYWRAKRLEPRILHFVRRNIVPLHALFGAAATAPNPAIEHHHEPLETRIRALEDRLDEYVRSIARIAIDPSAGFVIDDARTESGAYDPFFRFTKRSRGGTLEHRLDQLDRELTQNAHVLETFTRALLDEGLLTQETLVQRAAEQMARKGEWHGGRIVARAWVDPEFKKRLIANGREAVRELDIPPGRLAILGVAENTPAVHNVVVCTLCSCYPNELLGNPPWWYRHDSFKQRIVGDPRSALADMFGLNIPPDKVIEVHDSTSDLRWFVLPERPAGTEGWAEADLAHLVTIESLVGVATPAPEPLAEPKT